MSATNVAIARRWFQEIWNEGKTSTITELMHPSAAGHVPSGTIKGPAEWRKAVWEPLAGSFSGMEVVVEDTVASGDVVVVRWRARMRHTGTALGIAASDRSVAFAGLTWMTIRDGQIVEGWDGWDSTGLLVQCGGATLDPALR
jgi:predicted ester cyclase